VDLSRPLDPDPTVQKKEDGRGSPQLGFRRISSDVRSGVDDGSDAGALGGDGLHDKVQESVENSWAWSTRSTVS
jgi:hypothetical protein